MLRKHRYSSSTIFANEQDIDINKFSELCSQSVSTSDYPMAQDCQNNILVYPGELFDHSNAGEAEKLRRELHYALSEGPGVVVIRDTFKDLGVVDRQTATFERIREEERAAQKDNDHFAAKGANTRIWNALQKAAIADPKAFMDYYANPVIHSLSEAWLGPFYQITAQVNVVRPGGDAQQPHRDYHLGFQSNEVVARFPLAVHRLSSYLTLQGAVAHNDMPIESGPTLLLPFSHQYDLGYLAWRNQDFKDYFFRHAVQLPLSKGDQLYFNPALFHAAGSNRTHNHQRMANLLQISSAFGVPMESVDHDATSRAIYPHLQEAFQSGNLSEMELDNIIATAGDGYSFPTNLDKDLPEYGLAPQTGQTLLYKAATEGWSMEQLNQAIDARKHRRSA